MRRSLAAILVAVLLVVSGCSLGGSSKSDDHKSSSSPTDTPSDDASSDSADSPTSSATPTGGDTTAASPMTADQLRDASVPAACQMPTQRLSNNQTSPQYKPKTGAFILTGPMAPLTADVDGDGSQDLVAIYGCNAGNVGWPELLIAYGSGGRMLGYADLGKYDKKEHAAVQHWNVSDGKVHVHWMSFDGAGFGMTHHDSVLQLSGGQLQVSDTPASDTVTDVTNDEYGLAEFVSPTGNISCILSKTDARCDVVQHTWRAPARPSQCMGDYGNSVELTNSATFPCVTDSTRNGLTADVPEWFTSGLDPVVTFQGQRFRGLGYGHTLRAGNMSCTSAQLGITCTNKSTGRAFTVSREKIQIR